MTQTSQKIQEQFYPLTPTYSQRLRQAKLTAAEWGLWSFLISFDPWGDKYQDLPDTLTILSECDLKKSTFYKAIAKFQDLELFDFQDKGFKFRNLAGISKIRNFQNFGKDSEKSESIPETRKTVREIGKDSEKSENQPLETVQGNDPTTPQTLQTDHTPQTRAEEDQKKMTGLEEILGKESVFVELPEKASVPRVVQNTTKSSNLTPEMSARLEAFGIPLDGAVTKAITNHHPSQIWGAIRHIENTWETIENPRAIFLYQVPKQPIEKPLKEPLTPEFLSWYNEAISKGLVKNISPEILPINQFREPKVYLPDDRLEDWQKVAAGDVQPLANPEQMADFFKKLRGK